MLGTHWFDSATASSAGCRGIWQFVLALHQVNPLAKWNGPELGTLSLIIQMRTRCETFSRDLFWCPAQSAPCTESYYIRVLQCKRCFISFCGCLFLRAWWWRWCWCSQHVVLLSGTVVWTLNSVKVVSASTAIEICLFVLVVVWFVTHWNIRGTR